MSRKVFAKLEFRAKSDACKNNDESSKSFSCCFCPSDAVVCSYEYPLKLVLPSKAVLSCCQWVFPITFGGGLLEGDNIHFMVILGDKCCVLITTMSYPKVYCCPDGTLSTSDTHYQVASGALLCILPDPLVCFGTSNYSQEQIFHMHADSNLILLDWYTSGRYARGERWQFSKLRSVCSVSVSGSLEFRESQCLQAGPSLQAAMQDYDIFGVCMVMGPFLAPLADSMLVQMGSRMGYGEKIERDALFAVSPLKIKGEPFGCILRFAATSVSKAVSRVESLLSPLFPVLGGNPFANK